VWIGGTPLVDVGVYLLNLGLQALATVGLALVLLNKLAPVVGRIIADRWQTAYKAERDRENAEHLAKLQAELTKANNEQLAQLTAALQQGNNEQIERLKAALSTQVEISTRALEACDALSPLVFRAAAIANITFLLSVAPALVVDDGDSVADVERLPREIHAWLEKYGHYFHGTQLVLLVVQFEDRLGSYARLARVALEQHGSDAANVPPPAWAALSRYDSELTVLGINIQLEIHAIMRGDGRRLAQ
jgi:hypothetical protein